MGLYKLHGDMKQPDTNPPRAGGTTPNLVSMDPVR